MSSSTMISDFSEFDICSDPEPRQVQTYTFDFFNYAGIHRPVVLYSLPATHIADINLTSSITQLQNS